MTSDDAERMQLLVRVAELYYQQSLTQREIGDKLHLTRWQVGRLLRQARDVGVVRVEIVHPHARLRKLESELVQLTGLTDVIVVAADSANPRVTMAKVAQAAANFLADLSPAPRSVAMSWGKTMSAVARAIEPGWTRDVTVVQANGGMTRPGESDPAALITRLAHHGHGNAVFLPVPAVVTSASLAEALRHEDQIQQVLSLARTADVLMFSCGALSRNSVLVSSGCVSIADITHARSLGCVGDVLARYIDANGYPVCPDLEERTIGLTLDDIVNARLSVAVAAGEAKLAIADAVVRRGLCDVLITDSDTANFLIGRSRPVFSKDNHNEMEI